MYVAKINLEGFGEDFTDLSRTETISGLNISDLFNEWLTVFVDAPKEPHMANLGVTMQNINTALYLTQAGVDPTTIGLFLNQPIIKEYLRAKEVNDSMVSKENGSSISQRNLVKNVRNTFARGLQVGKTDEDAYGAERLFTAEELEEMIVNDDRSSQYIMAQYQILNDFIKYQAQARKISEAMQAINVDTNSGGKNISELLYKLRLIDKLTGEEIDPPVKTFKSKKGKDKVVPQPYIDGFSRLIGSTIESGVAVPDKSRNTFLGPYFEAVHNLKKIYEPFVRILRDPQVLDLLDHWINVLNNDGLSKDRIVRAMDQIKQDLFSYLVTTTEFEVDGVKFDMVNDKKKLFYGNTNIATRLNRLKKKHPNNAFLKRLKAVIPKREFYRGSDIRSAVQIKYISTKTEKIEQNSLVAAWEELRDIDPNFYYDLIKVCIMQTGFKNSPMSFWHLIPAGTFNKIMTEVLNKDIIQNANRNDFSEQVILQNSRNKDLVPTKPKEGHYFVATPPDEDEEGFTFSRILPIQKIEDYDNDVIIEVDPKFIPIIDLKEDISLQSWQKESVRSIRARKITKQQNQDTVDFAAEDNAINTGSGNPFVGANDDVEERIPYIEEEEIKPNAKIQKSIQEKTENLGMSVGEFMKTLSKEARAKLRDMIDNNEVQFKCR